MRIIKKIYYYLKKKIKLERINNQVMREFEFPKNLDIREDIQRKYNFSGELLDIFINNKNNLVHKWHHYIPLYDKYFSSFRHRKIRFLEIGVSRGGSLQMWRKYLGKEAIIFGIDIDPECKNYNGLAGQVRIGSQTDVNFLKSVVAEMGGIDIVLDDGSHVVNHQIVSLRTLFPKLNNSGIYFIEDIHTAYWNRFGREFNNRNRNNFFNKIQDIVDDMHKWYHKAGLKEDLISNSCSAIHIHDSIVVLEKNKIYPPVHSEVV
jgi:23S rRNA U2552 (ribose-2'-O)-methylase RlmE/FtsJ